jgi:NAD(P)-dependent dehydrogenase (short-subunit alcohol dehydrogenase family)
LFRATVAVTDDGGGVAEELIALLRDAGADAVLWDGRAVADVGALIFLGGLRPDTEDDDVAVSLEAFHAAQALGGRGSFVTVCRRGRSGPGALSRTCAREWPEAAVRAIEIEYGSEDEGDDAARVAGLVAAELLAGDTEADVVLRADGDRAGWTMAADSARLQVRPAPTDDSPIRAESVIVISGGGRGVTAACARALAQAHRPRIVLVGRTPLDEDPPELRAARTETELRAALVTGSVRLGERPQPFKIEARLRQILAVRELRETLDDIAAAGSPVRYVAADVADAGALADGLRAVRDEWGPVTGLVHGAGVLADRLVDDKTDEQFDRVMRVKVRGFRNLLDLVGDDDPSFVCVFSSVVVSAGNAGQCDYAAANEIVERMALEWSAGHPRCLVKAIAWGPWRGGMVSDELAEVFGEREIPLIPLTEGAAAFVDELSAPREQVRSLITATYGGSGRAGEAQPARCGQLEVSEVVQTWLADHRIGGRGVVPLAVVLDWMLRLVDVPESVALHDVDVVRGIAAPAVVSVLRSGSDLAVTDGASGPCYWARLGAGIGVEPHSAGAGGAPEPTGLAPIVRDPLYDGDTLFHGPSLQVLRRVDGVGANGAVGEVVGADALGWPDEPWRTDPAALDGAIQLAVVWAFEQTGRAMLPMFVREARFRPAGLEPGPLRCVVRAVSVGVESVVCDVSLLRRPPDPADGGDVADGEAVVAVLNGLELVARPR